MPGSFMPGTKLPHKKVEAETGPEATQERSKHEVESKVKDNHPYKILVCVVGRRGGGGGGGRGDEERRRNEGGVDMWDAPICTFHIRSLMT